MSKLIHAHMQETVRVKTRDALLTAEDPNNPSPNSVGGITDVGTIWDGIQRAVESLPTQAKDEILKRMNVYVRMQGGAPGPDGLTVATTDGARRAAGMAGLIGSINAKNAAVWKDVEASRPRR